MKSDTTAKNPSRLRQFVSGKASLKIKLMRTTAMLLLALGCDQAALLSGQRPLTSSEKQTLTDIFGTSLNTSKMRIAHSRYAELRLRAFGGASGASNGNTIISGKNISDFSKVDFFNKFVFVHEAAHVWQLQTRRPGYLLGEGIKNAFNSVVLGHDRQAAYMYDLKGGKDLLAFGSEQQADIIADRYVMMPILPPTLFKDVEKQPPEVTEAQFEWTLRNFRQNPGYAHGHRHKN